jgi:ABC-2 type transport system ATP-binding protein
MIELRGVQKVLGGKTVLDIPDLTVGAGEIAGVFGLEDSGRDALFSLLTGRIRPTLGTLRLAGVDPAQAQRKFSHLSGIVFSEDALYKNLSVRANLEFQADLYGVPKKRIDEVLALVGLADQAAVTTNSLPPGLKRRLAFGRAILHRPKVLILEELFARCDETTIVLLESLVRETAEDNTSVLLMASTAARLTPLCFRIYNIQQGRLLETRLETQEPGRQEFKLPVKLEDKVVLLNPAEILYADAGEGRVFLVTMEGRLPTQQRIFPGAPQYPGEPAAYKRSDPLHPQQLQHPPGRFRGDEDPPEQVGGRRVKGLFRVLNAFHSSPVLLHSSPHRRLRALFCCGRRERFLY